MAPGIKKIIPVLEPNLLSLELLQPKPSETSIPRRHGGPIRTPSLPWNPPNVSRSCRVPRGLRGPPNRPPSCAPRTADAESSSESVDGFPNKLSRIRAKEMNLYMYIYLVIFNVYMHLWSHIYIYIYMYIYMSPCVHIHEPIGIPIGAKSNGKV